MDIYIYEDERKEVRMFTEEQSQRHFKFLGTNDLDFEELNLKDQLSTTKSDLKKAISLIGPLLKRTDHTLECHNYADPKECECGTDKLQDKARAFLQSMKGKP